MKTKILFFTTIFLLSGCGIKSYAPKNDKIKTIDQPNFCITYYKGNIKNEINATIIDENGVALSANAVKVALYEGSLVGFGVLQFISPSFNLRTIPGQNLRVKISDGNESNVTYVFNNRYPYSFRIGDKVILDVNQTDIITIKAADDHNNSYYKFKDW